MIHRNVARSIKNFKVNPVVKTLILSDFIVWGSFGFVSPIFAIFITENIQNAGVEAAGIAASIHLVTKAICEIPVGIFIDRTKSEKDDLYSALIGTTLTGLVYASYIFISSIAQLYFLQFLLGVASALAFPGWYSIFTKHVDKGKEGFEWSMYDVSIGIGTALTAALGGFLVVYFGFNLLFTIITILTFIGSFLLLIIRKQIIQ